MDAGFEDVLAGLRRGRREAIEQPPSLPLVRGREILFVYDDRERPARAVRLVHHVATLDRAPRLYRAAPGQPYVLHLVLPPGARLEYTFGIVYADGGEEIRPDPRNPELAWCPFGPKSVATTANYRTPVWARPYHGAGAGRLEEHEIASAALGGRRVFWVYRPAAPPPPGGYPVLLVHDGNDYLDFAAIRDVLDHQIAAGAMAPVLALLSKPVNRNHEYSCTAPHAAFLAEELLPWVRARYPASSARRLTGLMGASFGAVASVYAAYHYPDLFGRLLLQSGSFRFQHVIRTGSPFAPLDEFDRITLFLESEFFPDGPAGRLRVFHSCGTFESILSYNRSFAAEMKRLGHQVEYRESHDGHNWISWRDQFGSGLAWLYPGGRRTHRAAPAERGASRGRSADDLPSPSGTGAAACPVPAVIPRAGR